MTGIAPIVEAERVSKRYGAVVALKHASVTLYPGRVTCLLGDNGAGKSTLIKILSGVIRPDSGVLRVNGDETSFESPTDALDNGIATVFQDLAMVPQMPVYRNFVLGREPTKWPWPFRRLDGKLARKTAEGELQRFGLPAEHVRRPIVTLSGGQRQAVAIAKAMHYGAKVLVLDEPTSALGVRQASVVLQYIRAAKEHGLAILFITHNVHHAFPTGDSFTVLSRGEVVGAFEKGELTIGELASMMASGEDIAQLEGITDMPVAERVGGATDTPAADPPRARRTDDNA